MSRLRSQAGVSLVELLMTVAVLAIAAAIIFGPSAIKANKSADESAMPGLLDRAAASAQDYYAGSGNPTGSGTMDGFAANAPSVDSRINWDPVPGEKLTRDPSELESGIVYIANAGGNQVKLCVVTPSSGVALCMADKGGVKSYYASTMNMSEAAGKAGGNGQSCPTAGKALLNRDDGC